MSDMQISPERTKRKYERKRPFVPRAQQAAGLGDESPTMGADPIEPIAPQVREPVREQRPNDRPKVVARDGLGRSQVLGRDGEVLARTRTGTVDIFYIDPAIIPDGWSYEWKAMTVTGEPQRAHQATLHANGWRAVPAKRHDGVFMTPAFDGPIEQGGQILMERPMVLTMEARADMERAAQNQVKMKQQALGENMPKGFTMEHSKLPNRVKTSFERSDVARPTLELADD